MRLLLIPAALLALSSLPGCTFDQMADFAVAAEAVTATATAVTAVNYAVNGPAPTVVYVTQAGAPVYSCPPGTYPINGGTGCMMDSSAAAPATGATGPAVGHWEGNNWIPGAPTNMALTAAQRDPNNPANQYTWQPAEEKLSDSDLLMSWAKNPDIAAHSKASRQAYKWALARHGMTVPPDTLEDDPAPPKMVGNVPANQPGDDYNTRLQNARFQQMSEGTTNP